MTRKTQPSAPRDNFVERLHGHNIQDPYRWMENSTPALREWVHGQHKYTAAILHDLPCRQTLQARLTELIDVDVSSIRVAAGNRYFFWQRSADQALPVLYVQNGPDGPPRVLIDQNQLSPDHTTILSNTFFSSDGSLIAYRLSEAGSSMTSLYVMDVETGKVLSDVIPGELNPAAHVWHTENRVLWKKDNSGFYYTRRPQSVPPGEERYHQKLWFHRLGDDCADDALVFGEKLAPGQSPYPRFSSDGRYLIVDVHDLSAEKLYSEIYVCDLSTPGQKFVPIVTGRQAYCNAQISDGKIFIKTNHGAPFFKVVAATLTHLGNRDLVFETVIPEGTASLGSWKVIGKVILVETCENVSSQLRAHDLSGSSIREIALPGVGSVEIGASRANSSEVVFSYSSFFAPPATFTLDVETLEYTRWRQQETHFDPDMFEVEQVWYASPDQTKIPMFLLRRKGLQQNGDNPCVVYGYGGFNVSLKPSFKADIIPFLERGGIYAIANVRGGGEFGAVWHEGGRRKNKQNTFDDFNAAAECLIAMGYTSPGRLGCLGWSNGGLLVNTAALQRPDLWQAVVSGAPITDMARFHTYPSGMNCVSDYGSPDDPDDLEFLLKYSPYHNMPDQIEAPAVMIFVPDEDDRVAPWQGYKMLAQWQAANVSENPVLLRRAEKSGHKGSASASDDVAKHTDIWSFLFWQLGVS